MEKKIIQSESLQLLQEDLLKATTKAEIIEIAEKIRNSSN